MSNVKQDAPEKTWKDFLLQSGLPLEYEILRFLDKKGCITSHEFPYLRDNEHNDETEFSYDIDASYGMKLPYWIDLMIECKYRHDSTKWIFLPEDYGGPDEIAHTSFMHPLDHFNKQNKFWMMQFPDPFALLCSKGIEITGKEFNPKSITQAEMQLAYAMVHKVVDAMHHQTDEILSETFEETVWCHIPIIVTTAKLYRLNPGTTIASIRNADEIDSIAQSVDSVVIKAQPTLQLEQYNLKHLTNFLAGKRQFLESKLNSFNKEIDFVLSVIAKQQCPNCMIVLHHDEENKAFEKLFTYLHEVIKPGPEIFEEIKRRRTEIEDRMNARVRKKAAESGGVKDDTKKE